MKSGCVAPDSFLQQLKQRTRAEHDSIEGALALTDPAITLAGYRRTLVRLHGFYRPLEACMAALPTSAWAIDPAPRYKTALLEADLAALGEPAGAQAAPAQLPALESQAQRLGCLYVLEGSTLGGQVIARHLRERLSIEPATGGRFFHGNGERTGSMWLALRAVLAGFAQSQPQHREAVVDAARLTFVRLQNWFGETGQ